MESQVWVQLEQLAAGSANTRPFIAAGDVHIDAPARQLWNINCIQQGSVLIV